MCLLCYGDSVDIVATDIGNFTNWTRIESKHDHDGLTRHGIAALIKLLQQLTRLAAGTNDNNSLAIALTKFKNVETLRGALDQVDVAKLLNDLEHKVNSDTAMAQSHSRIRLPSRVTSTTDFTILKRLCSARAVHVDKAGTATGDCSRTCQQAVPRS